MLIVLLVPLVPVAGLLFLLAAERLDGRVDRSGLREFERSQSALLHTVDRASRSGDSAID